MYTVTIEEKQGTLHRSERSSMDFYEACSFAQGAITALGMIGKYDAYNVAVIPDGYALSKVYETVK